MAGKKMIKIRFTGVDFRRGSRERLLWLAGDSLPLSVWSAEVAEREQRPLQVQQ